MTCNLLIRVTSEDLRSVHSIKITRSRPEPGLLGITRGLLGMTRDYHGLLGDY